MFLLAYLNTSIVVRFFVIYIMYSKRSKNLSGNYSICNCIALYLSIYSLTEIMPNHACVKCGSSNTNLNITVPIIGKAKARYM